METHKWQAAVVGKMHIHDITQRQLAAEIGWTPEWVSKILRGRVSPKNAQDVIETALEDIITRKDAE